MFKQNRLLFAIFSLCCGAAAFFAFSQFNNSAVAEMSKTWVTMDLTELNQIQKIAESQNRPLALEVLQVRNNIAIVQATEFQIQLLSGHAHTEFQKCGGFIAHESETDALATIERFARADAELNLVDYTINNAATVNALSGEMQAANVAATINHLSAAYTTRYYNSASGLQSATWIKNNWATLAAARSDVTVEFFTHPTWQQPSVILTIPGTVTPSEVIVLGGHQDSIRSGCSAGSTCQTLVAPGADDDASGIASLTEIIRVAIAKNYRPAKTVKFMAYAAEEVGLRGSNAIALDFQTRGVNVVGVMQLDMTNYKGASQDIALITDFTNAAQNQFIRNLATAYLPGLVVTNDTCGYGCSDHAAWFNRGFPASFPHESTIAQSNTRIHSATDTLANMDTTGAHALKFSKLGAAFMGELAKGTALTSIPSKARADFDADGRTDFSVFRGGEWFVQRSSGGFAGATWGTNGDTVTPGDFDGDLKTDYAIFRATANAGTPDFYIIRSSNSAPFGIEWGTTGDVPKIGDFDGDAKDDFAVYRPSNNTWYLLMNTGGFVSAQLGGAGDIPVVLNYDNDNKTDLAMWNANTGVWTIQKSTGGSIQIQFGQSGDKLAPADYDNDNRDDLAIFRSGVWYVLKSSNGQIQNAYFGQSGDVPVPGDFDGNGADDFAVYRSGTWFVQTGSSSFSTQFGITGDIPIPTGYIVP